LLIESPGVSSFSLRNREVWLTNTPDENTVPNIDGVSTAAV
jgi:hypothetical protein